MISLAGLLSVVGLHFLLSPSFWGLSLVFFLPALVSGSGGVVFVLFCLAVCMAPFSFECFFSGRFLRSSSTQFFLLVALFFSVVRTAFSSEYSP